MEVFARAHLMSDVKRSPDELVAASAHLHYEVSMFDTTARVLMAGVFGEGPDRNAFLESFTIHTRALLQVFHPSGSDQSDVLAEHFFADRMTWLRLRGGVPKVLADVERRVGNEIAHLSYDRLRVGPDAKDWNVHDIWMAVMGLVQIFIGNAPRDLLADKWRTSIVTEPTNAGAPASSAESLSRVVTDVSSPAVHQPFQGASQSRG
jgi:hypothetical protein